MIIWGKTVWVSVFNMKTKLRFDIFSGLYIKEMQFDISGLVFLSNLKIIFTGFSGSVGMLFMIIRFIPSDSSASSSTSIHSLSLLGDKPNVFFRSKYNIFFFENEIRNGVNNYHNYFPLIDDDDLARWRK